MLILLILTIILILLLLLSMIWPPDSPWSPWWRTSGKTAQRMIALANISEDDVIFDLGSGDGTALITAAKIAGAKGVGVEIDPLRVFISKLAIKVNGVDDRITVLRKNFFEVELSEATVVFMYLVPKALNKLKPKLLKELKPGTRIVTFIYQLDLPLIVKDEKNEVYVYQVPSRKK